MRTLHRLVARLRNFATGRDAASAYKVEIDVITAKVKQEFAAKEKAKRAAQAATKPAKETAA